MNPKTAPSTPAWIIEAEEPVYTYQPADNGASPLWCVGSTCLVRVGHELFASGLETIPGAKPLHNCRWTLFRRAASGWELIRRDEQGRTREPCPLVAFPDERIFLSANPTLTPPDTYQGPARPEILQFSAADPHAPPQRLLPPWSEPVTFSEHSYRHFAADAANRELILFHNLEMDRAYWSFLDRAGCWSASGKLLWPWGADYEVPQPIRLCYCNVQLRNRAVYVWGTSDILEPVTAWREFKYKLTGRKWDYDFRRLFFSWTPDITREPFRPWLEVASREKTAGHARNCDLWVAPDGLVHLLWRERAIDERLRERFFPDERQSYSVRYARIKDDRVILRQTVAEGGEGLSPQLPDWARFHMAADGRLFAVLTLGGPARVNQLLPIRSDGTFGPPLPLSLRHPFLPFFFTATPRAGSPPSDTLDLLGECPDEPHTIRHARVRLVR